MGSLDTALHRDGNGMGDGAKISPHIPTTGAQNAILSSLNIRIIPSRLVSVAIANQSLIPSVSSHTTTCYLANYVYAADDVAHIESLQATAARACLGRTNVETGSKLPEFSDVVMCMWATQYSKKAPSSFRRLILNSHCCCHRR
jgi:hypothetical protein